jgi:hypothetical protein
MTTRTQSHIEDAAMSPRLASIALAMIPISALVGCEPAKPTAPAKPKVAIRETANKTTEKILKLDEALKGGGKLAATSVTSGDYLGAVSDAYKTTAGWAGVTTIEKAIQMRNASNIQEPKPLSYDELMTEIMKKGQPDAITLPQLPFYQEYAWDEPSQKLVVVEFPELKERQKKEQDKELGRR